MSVWLALALAGSLAANVLLWRLYKAASRAATTEARNAVLEAIQTHQNEVNDVAHEQAQINAVDRGGASAVLERLRGGSPSERGTVGGDFSNAAPQDNVRDGMSSSDGRS